MKMKKNLKYLRLLGAGAVLIPLTGCVNDGGYGPGFDAGIAPVIMGGMMGGDFYNGPGIFGPSFGDFEDFGGYGGLGGFGLGAGDFDDD